MVDHARHDEPELRPEDRAFLDWLLLRKGINPAHYRRETLARRFQACLRALRSSSVAQARGAVERNGRLLDTALNALLIGVTSFFRDERAFAALRDVALPQLPASPEALRVWSVGCSDGAELYSVAMLLAERGTLRRCELLGTDCRADAVRAAAAGRFSAAAVRAAIPVQLAERYIRPGKTGDEHHIAAELRERTRWHVADVLQRPEPGPWDLILCRNMAIYLRSTTVVKLWDALHEQLRPGGFLLVGKSERPAPAHGRFVNVAPCLYRRETPAGETNS